MSKKFFDQIKNWRQIYLLVFLISALTALISAAIFFTHEFRGEHKAIEDEISDIQQLSDLISPLVESFDLRSINVSISIKN